MPKHLLPHDYLGFVWLHGRLLAFGLVTAMLSDFGQTFHIGHQRRACGVVAGAVCGRTYCRAARGRPLVDRLTATRLFGLSLLPMIAAMVILAQFDSISAALHCYGQGCGDWAWASIPAP